MVIDYRACIYIYICISPYHFRDLNISIVISLPEFFPNDLPRNNLCAVKVLTEGVPTETLEVAEAGRDVGRETIPLVLLEIG